MGIVTFCPENLHFIPHTKLQNLSIASLKAKQKFCLEQSKFALKFNQWEEIMTFALPLSFEQKYLLTKLKYANDKISQGLLKGEKNMAGYHKPKKQRLGRNQRVFFNVLPNLQEQDLIG